MKNKCYILDDYQAVALKIADWSRVEKKYDVVALKDYYCNEANLISKISDAEILVIMRERTKITKNLIDSCPNLKLVVTSGMRNSSIDIAYATAKGISVCGTESGSTPPAELTWALILAWNKKIVTENIARKNPQIWQSQITEDLNGKNLGILGLGKIGKQVAKVGLAFGMNVFAWSPNLKEADALSAGVKFCKNKSELLSVSDILSIHLVLSDRSKNIIDAADLELMKPASLLVNTSRAGLVNTNALIHSIEVGKIAGACLDVYDIEPLPAEHKLRNMPQILGTPHLGYVANSNYQKYFIQGVEDIESFMDGKIIRGLN